MYFIFFYNQKIIQLSYHFGPLRDGFTQRRSLRYLANNWRHLSGKLTLKIASAKLTWHQMEECRESWQYFTNKNRLSECEGSFKKLLMRLKLCSLTNLGLTKNVIFIDHFCWKWVNKVKFRNICVHRFHINCFCK